MNVGDHIEVLINTVAFGGAGIGKMLDLVVFVPFTVEGDQCEVKITAVKKNYLTGHLERILKASPRRIEPSCPYYTICGGCQYQHIGYEHQITIKEKQLRETFERIGKINAPDIRSMIHSPKIYNYRGKADFQVQVLRENAPLVGFIDTSGSKITPIARCEIVDESINNTLSGLRNNLLIHKIRMTTDRYTVWSDFEKDLILSDIDAIRLPKYIDRFVKGKRIQIPYNGFFQINTVLVDELVDTVEKMCDLTGNESVLDGYCGSGLFSIFLAPHADKVYGIDSDGAAIHCAKINGRREGMNHMKFYRGDVFIIMDKEFVQAELPVDCVILDPPRNGCDKDVLNAIIALKPKKLIYISCNPATQARDIRYLIDRGVSLKYLQPLDMFPQTQHIEAIALLEY